MEKDDVKVNLAPYLGCSKKLIEFFAIIGYEEEEIKRCAGNMINNQMKIDLTFLSIIISDFSYDIATDYIIKQVYPDKPKIIESESSPKQDSIIFSTCIDSLDGEKKIFNSCFAFRFYEKIEIPKRGEIFYIPKAFLIYSQYPYFSTYRRICEKIYLSSEQQSEDKEFPIEIFIHCLVNYFPSPINNNIILKDFSPPVIIPKLTGYPYADFNLGKILSLINLVDFIKIYILIFLELDLLIFSPDLEKLNIFMFALYILNYPLTDSNYFWHIKTISLGDITSGEGDDTVTTSFKGVNSIINTNIDLSDFKALNFVIDLENKKQTIISFSENTEEREINLLLKYVGGILNSNLFFKKSFFMEGYLLKLYKNLKIILKEYNDIASKDSDVANNFFYVNKSISNINRQIQEAFYDFILNILVELNKDFSFDPSLQNPVIRKIIDNPKLSEEEKIFLNYSRDTIKYNTYFNNFINEFKVYDGLKVSLLFSDEYVNLKKQEKYKEIEEKVKYFEIMDKLYITKNTDLIYNLKNLDTEYSKSNYIAKAKTKKNKKVKNLFNLDGGIIKKFIYKKKCKDYYEVLKEPDELHVDIENKNRFTFTIQNYFSLKGLLKEEFYIRGTILYIISLCFPFFSKERLPSVVMEYLNETKKIIFFQRYFIFIFLKAINAYYQLNKEKGIFPEIGYNEVQKYYEMVQNHLKENSIVQDEEIFLFFKRHFGVLEENDKNNKNDENFCYKNNVHKIEGNIKENLKFSENEIILDKDTEVIKYTTLNLQNISEIFLESYLYYDYFLFNNCQIKNFEVNKICEKVVNLINFLLKYKDSQNVVDNLYYLVNSLIDFKNQLQNYQKSMRKKLSKFF